MKRKNKSGSGCSECDAKKVMSRIKGKIPSYSDGDDVDRPLISFGTKTIAPIGRTTRNLDFNQPDYGVFQAPGFEVNVPIWNKRIIGEGRPSSIGGGPSLDWSGTGSYSLYQRAGESKYGRTLYGTDYDDPRGFGHKNEELMTNILNQYAAPHLRDDPATTDINEALGGYGDQSQPGGGSGGLRFGTSLDYSSPIRGIGRSNTNRFTAGLSGGINLGAGEVHSVFKAPTEHPIFGATYSPEGRFDYPGGGERGGGLGYDIGASLGLANQSSGLAGELYGSYGTPISTEPGTRLGIRGNIPLSNRLFKKNVSMRNKRLSLHPDVSYDFQSKTPRFGLGIGFKDGGDVNTYDNGSKVTTTDPPVNTGNIAPDPVSNDLMNYSLNFECDTASGQGCHNRYGSLFRLGLKGGLNFSKGFAGQPKNLGPGWDNEASQYVDNRIGTYDHDASANIGGYLRTNLPHIFNPYGDPSSFWSFLNDRNWNPVHLDLGYNYNQPINVGGVSGGKGTHNLTARLAHSGDRFAGSPGYGGFFGNKGGSSRPQFSYGLEGNYDLTNKQLTNIGAYGQIGLLGPVNISGSAGYNPQTRKPHFNLGFGSRLEKGGTVPSYNNGDGVGLGFGGSELSAGTSGLLTKLNPNLVLGSKLSLGGEYSGLHNFNEGPSKYVIGGTGNLDISASGRRVRDWDPRFVGSLSGSLGYGKTGSEKMGNLSNQGMSASGRLDLGVGRPGKTFCVGNACSAAPVTPWSITGFGEYGNQYSLNPGLRTGVKGQWNWLSGEGGYDLTNKSPFFKAGLNIPIR